MTRARAEAHAAALLFFLWGLGVVSCARAREPAAAPPPPSVLVTQAVVRDLPLTLEAVGTLDGYLNVDLRARVRGFLASQHQPDGAWVKQGELLFTIDPAEYQDALASARASLSRAVGTRDHARVALGRRRQLAPRGFVSQQELDDAVAAQRDAVAQVEVAQAQVQQAELNLSYTRIRSPVSGLSGLALVRPGNLVGQDGPTLLTTVSQVDPMRVTFPLSEGDFVRSPSRLKRLEGRDLGWAHAQLARLDRGEEGEDPGLELVLSDGKPYPHRGVIVSANRQVDPTTGTIQLQALFPNPDGELRPGQFGRVRLPRPEEGKGVLAVPEKALLQVQGTYSLAVVGPGNKVQLRRVEVGPAAQGLRVVRSGLQAGEQVVVEGVQKVTDGAVVRPEPARLAEAGGPAPG